MSPNSFKLASKDFQGAVFAVVLWNLNTVLPSKGWFPSLQLLCSIDSVGCHPTGSFFTQLDPCALILAGRFVLIKQLMVCLQSSKRKMHTLLHVASGCNYRQFWSPLAAAVLAAFRKGITCRWGSVACFVIWVVLWHRGRLVWQEISVNSVVGLNKVRFGL